MLGAMHRDYSLHSIDSGGPMATEVEVLLPREHVLHRPHSGNHPERPERIDMVMRGLAGAGISVRVLEPAERPREVLLSAHDSGYIELVERLSRHRGYIDSDTYLTPHTFRIAMRAASASIEAAEKIIHGSSLGIALPRPPGHHAGRSGRALGAPTQGFCIFNNAALASIRLIESGYEPVAVIDIDIHHGNGTQEIFWRDPRVVHIDLHDSSIYPGTGWHIDVGSGEGAGTKINIPLIPGNRDPEYIHAWVEVVEPALYFFKPRAIVISAGFDAHEGEFMGYVKLTTELYRWLGHRLWELSRRIASVSGVVFVLEGGYGPGLYEGLPSFLQGLLGRGAPEISGKAGRARPENKDLVESIKRTINTYYSVYT